MTLNGIPISTAGLYHSVSLTDKEPRFKLYKNWLALVYTKPEIRQQGYGALICKYIEECSKKIGIDTIYLFTNIAESLYKRLGWAELERLNYGNRIVIVMKKIL